MAGQSSTTLTRYHHHLLFPVPVQVLLSQAEPLSSPQSLLKHQHLLLILLLTLLLIPLP
jgi:hypothetical protein